MIRLNKKFKNFLKLCLVLGMIGLLCLIGIVVYFSKDLPDYKVLQNYQPKIVTRLYAGDGQLISEYATEKRVFIPISEVPEMVKNAFISAEDKSFYHHYGISPTGIIRAIADNIKQMGTGRRPAGASTITQQVAKNFLLTNELSITRKVKEAIIAVKIENALRKDEILELYLNEIFLGMRAYGVVSASLNYFNKGLDELTIAQCAYLAALPKAPNNYHPIKNREEAIGRRNWVLDNMYKNGYISEAELQQAKAEDIIVQIRDSEKFVENSAYFSEEVRRELLKIYGEEELYDGGLSVKTTLDPELQEMAHLSLQEGLIEYDKRHGWRGPLSNVAEELTQDNWTEILNNDITPNIYHLWEKAIVTKVENDVAFVGLEDGSYGKIPLKWLSWARRNISETQKTGKDITSVHEVLKFGDIIFVQKFGEEDIDNSEEKIGLYGIRQIPEINGAIIVMDPHTGRVLAMDGGFNHKLSKYNRATQAERQPGSAFKPIVYTAALESGFTPSTLIYDAPFVLDQGEGKAKWRPSNYSNVFYGPTPLRVGIEKSRNLMTVRLAKYLGMTKIIDYTVNKFKVMDSMRRELSMALGSGDTTLFKMVRAYASIVNGGKEVQPSFIDRVQDKTGKTLYRRDNRNCEFCQGVEYNVTMDAPELPDNREQLIDEKVAYQMTSIMEGVVQRGTARRNKSLNIPLAGKTGTTNDSKDAWFIGFSPDLVIGVFTGFDDPRTLGEKETGSSVASPIFKSFVEKAKEAVRMKAIPFRIPGGIKQVRVSLKNGQKTSMNDTNGIWEAFIPGTEPTREGQAKVLNSNGFEDVNKPTEEKNKNVIMGTGGLY